MNETEIENNKLLHIQGLFKITQYCWYPEHEKCKNESCECLCHNSS